MARPVIKALFTSIVLFWPICFVLQENSGRNDKQQNDRTTSVVSVRIGIEVEVNTFNENKIDAIQKQSAGHSPFRGRQAFVRLTTPSRREVDEGERGGVVVGCSPNVVVVELAAMAVPFYLI